MKTVVFERLKIHALLTRGFLAFDGKLRVPTWTRFSNLLNKKVNKALVNNAIYKIPTRPYPFSTRSPYTSWESLTDRTYSGLHLPPLDWQPLINPNYFGVHLATADTFEKNLPPVEALEVLYRQTKETKYSPKSTLIFPYFVQWFTDSFLRTGRQNQLKNTSNHHIDLCTVYGQQFQILDYGHPKPFISRSPQIMVKFD